MNIRGLILLAVINLGLVAGSGLELIIPLVPIAALTGHAGLLGSGLVGAGLLRLKAAAALGALLALKYPHRGIKVEHEVDAGEGWGWRRRRSVEQDGATATESETNEALSNVDMTQFDPSLDQVLQYDQLGCGLRLVCELSATPDETLQEDEKLILELFGRDGKAPNPLKASRGKLTYSYASLLGNNSQDTKVCTRVYGRCPYSGKEIMDSIRTANL